MLGSLMTLMPRRLWTRMTIALSLVIAVPAHATWSIILINVRTGEIVLGSATCLTSFDLKAGTPVIVPGFGAVTAQSFVDSTGQNRVFARDQLLMGTDPQEILNRLRTFDTGHETRQYGIVDTLGRTATFSGVQASQWKGGVTGTFSTPDGDVAYAIQGNILTGENVVAAAELAVINTSGNLAERLMAGMEAARSMGGDGRCSCNRGATACGSPPANFTKSAHIAYMLISRDGDTAGCHGLYRVTRTAYDVATGDLDGDGRPDVVSTSTSFPELSILYNATSPESPFALFEQAVKLQSRRSRDIKILDVNGDNFNDIVTADQADGSISVILGKAGRDFESPVFYAAGAAPEKLAIADFDGKNGPDIAVADVGARSIAILLNDGNGVFTLASTIPLAERPEAIAAGDADSDNDIDLLVPVLGLDIVQVLDNDATGTFSTGMTIPTADAPNSIAVGKLNADQHLDLVIGTSTGNVMSVLLRDGAGYTKTDHPLGSRALNVSIGNLNGDSHPDIVAFGSSVPDLAVFSNAGDGSFVQDGAFAARYNTRGVGLADFDGDGLDDIAGGALARVAVAVFENRTEPGEPITFTDGQGCAQGDWFMDFNVAFQNSASPDPVFQLQDMYAQWRSDLVGRPDAVVSHVTIDDPVLNVGRANFFGEDAIMTIELLDWQGLPITTPLASLPNVVSTNGLIEVRAITPMGNGVYEVELRAGSRVGVGSFEITIDDGVRPVVLMPQPTIETTCFADCDQSTGVGVLDIFDFLCFQSGFVNGTQYACACSGGGPLVCDIFDFLCFQDAFVAGCP